MLSSATTAKGFDSDGNKAGRWLKNESDMLKKAVQIYSADRQWTQVSAFLSANGVNRGPTQCRHRWNTTMRPNLRKGTWDESEDDILRKEVTKNLALCGSVGKINWQVLADTVLPSRTGKACWERWIFRLDPSIDRSPFTPEQDTELMRLHSELGNKWATIAKRMSKAVGVPNGTRTADQIKSRFISLKRIHKKGNSPKTSPPYNHVQMYTHTIQAHDQVLQMPTHMHIFQSQQAELFKRERTTSSCGMQPTAQRTKVTCASASPPAAGVGVGFAAEDHSNLSGNMDTLLGSMLGEMSISVDPTTLAVEAAEVEAPPVAATAATAATAAIAATEASANARHTIAGAGDSSLLDLDLLKSMDNFLAAEMCSDFAQHTTLAPPQIPASTAAAATAAPVPPASPAPHVATGAVATSISGNPNANANAHAHLKFENQDERELIESVESQLDRIFGTMSYDSVDLRPDSDVEADGRSYSSAHSQPKAHSCNQQHCAADIRYSSLSSLLELSM